MPSIFHGASAEQDSRFSDKTKKLLRTTKFPPNFDTKVDTKKINLESLLPWITKQVTKLLGNDDDVVTGYIQGSLENVKVDPKEMQLALAGFLDKHTAGFMRRCAVIAAGPYTPIHPLTSPYTPLQQPAHPPRSPPSPRPFCPLHESRRLESHRHRSCQVRGWRTRDRK